MNKFPTWNSLLHLIACCHDGVKTAHPHRKLSITHTLTCYKRRHQQGNTERSFPFRYYCCCCCFPFRLSTSPTSANWQPRYGLVLHLRSPTECMRNLYVRGIAAVQFTWSAKTRENWLKQEAGKEGGVDRSEVWMTDSTGHDVVVDFQLGACSHPGSSM